MIKQEIKFLNIIIKYLEMEYDSKYLALDRNIKNLVSAYYWGGNSVPETARAIVDYIDSQRDNA